MFKIVLFSGQIMEQIFTSQLSLAAMGCPKMSMLRNGEQGEKNS